MSNPRDWFRRRRRDPLDVIPPEPADPFENGPVLELGPAGVAPRKQAELRSGGAAGLADELVDAEPERPRAGSVPPPPPRRSDLRTARIIEAEQFSVRPEIVRPAREPDRVPASPPPAAEPVAARAPEIRRPSQPDAVFALKRKAVPLPRRTARAATPNDNPAAAVFAIEPAAPRAIRTAASITVGDDDEQTMDAAPLTATLSGRRPAPPVTRDDREMPEQPREPRRNAGDRSVPDLPREPRRSTAETRSSAEDESGMPGFTLAAPGASWVRGTTTLNDAGTMNAILRDAFTPTRPKQQGSLFSGRYKQMQRIIAAIEEERAHVVLYGERGSGKTSLANVIATKAEEAGYHVLKFACSSELGFDDIFRGFLRRIPGSFLPEGLGAHSRRGVDTFEQLLNPGEVSVGDLIQVLARIHDRHVILVIDEYDRITNRETKSKLAEFIKNMSDASAPVTILLIGVAEDVDDLLGKHPSLQRTLVTIPLPLMTDREIEGIITAGERKSGISFEPGVRADIVRFAQGLPYHAQLLCLFAARNALRRHSTQVGDEDLRYALLRAVEEAENRLKDAYNQALGTQGGAAFKDALFLAARCASDEFGTFSVADMLDTAEAEGDEEEATLALQEPLKRLTEAERGAVLRRVPTPEGLRYRFFNQMMRHYVLVRQSLERGLV